MKEAVAWSTVVVGQLGVLVDGDSSAHFNSGAGEVEDETARLKATSSGLCHVCLLQGAGHPVLTTIKLWVAILDQVIVQYLCTEVSILDADAPRRG